MPTVYIWGAASRGCQRSDRQRCVCRDSRAASDWQHRACERMCLTRGTQMRFLLRSCIISRTEKGRCTSSARSKWARRGSGRASEWWCNERTVRHSDQICTSKYSNGGVLQRCRAGQTSAGAEATRAGSCNFSTGRRACTPCCTLRWPVAHATAFTRASVWIPSFLLHYQALFWKQRQHRRSPSFPRATRGAPGGAVFATAC
mmetsp:Transcript_6497/g.13024  ORF Transcript_6497/g.13024 Transcript_6497/m.13024 type:complete len:202 (+) Transcript_6497:117-722(+)